MEQRNPMMRRCVHILLLTYLVIGGPALATKLPDRVVLIVASGSGVSILDAIDIKRLFLGIPVMVNGTKLHALRNNCDERMDLIFLQHVVAMSESVYERRLLALTLEQGRRAPLVFHDATQLITALAADRTAVSYAWESSIRSDPRVRVLREIWRE
jgi:hypothetical protein